MTNATETTEPRDYTVPPCPDWCAFDEGHPFEPLGNGELTRSHEVEFGDDADVHSVAIGVWETMSDGIPNAGVPFIDIDVSGLGDADEARGLAGQLLAAADKLDEINGAK
jgi:hypothetical protein